MVTDEQADEAIAAFFDLVGRRTGIASLPLSRRDARDGFKAALQAALARARREALKEAAAKLGYVAAEMEMTRSEDGLDRIFEDVAIRTLRTAITAIRALASQPPAPPKET